MQFRLTSVQWRRIAAVLGSMCTLLGATLMRAPSAQAYSLLPSFWRDPGNLGICFDSKSYGASGDDPARYPLPNAYRAPLTSGMQEWSRSATAVLFRLQDKCASTTHVRVHGVKLGRYGSGGTGGCLYYPRAYDGYMANECIRGTGFVHVNIDIPVAEHPRYFVFLAMHELGHVIGLAHPYDGRCQNKCFGPVMSYGSCPSEDRCVVTISTDDMNGANKKYHYKPSRSTGGGGNCRHAYTIRRALEGVGQSADAADARASSTDDDVAEHFERTGVADVTRSTTGQDPPAAYGTVNGTAGKALWNADELISEVVTRC